MSEIDSRELGARIRDSRERAGLSQSELGDAVGLERTAVNKIERGVRRLTALELSDVAFAVGVSMSSFFADPIPALVSYRSHQGLDTSESQIDRRLADLGLVVEFVKSLDVQELGMTDLDSRLPGVPFRAPRTVTEADAMARSARSLLGLNSDEPVRDLVTLVADIGLLAFSTDLGLDTADAGTMLLAAGGVSLVNSHNKVGRRRLALAHELGHYLVADQYTIDWRVSEHGEGDLEARLDRFARALLLPAPGLTKRWSELSTSNDVRDVAVRVASEYRVDMATLARRVRELALVAGDESNVVRTTSTTRSDIVEFGLYVANDMEGTTMPASFQKAVIRLCRDERISRARALELLQGTFDDSDLPAPRTRREDEIWNFVS